MPRLPHNRGGSSFSTSPSVENSSSFYFSDVEGVSTASWVEGPTCSMSVVSAGRKSDSVNTAGSVGQIPVSLSPLIAVFMVAL